MTTTSSLILLSIVPLLSVVCLKCPPFQSIIPLRPSVTTSNWSHAVIADSKYYLVGSRGSTHRYVEASGDMPSGFEDSSLTTVVDGLQCNHSFYHLITIKVIIDTLRANRTLVVDSHSD